MRGRTESILRNGGKAVLDEAEGDWNVFDNFKNEFREAVISGRMVAACVVGNRLVLHGGLRTKVREVLIKEIIEKGIKEDEITLKDLADHINEVFLDAVKREDYSHAIFWVDRTRGGDDEVGGIFWSDYDDLMNSRGANIVEQVVAHSPERVQGAKVRISDSQARINIDVGLANSYGGNNSILIVENNRLVVDSFDQDHSKWEREDHGEFIVADDSSRNLHVYSKSIELDLNVRLKPYERKEIDYKKYGPIAIVLFADSAEPQEITIYSFNDLPPEINRRRLKSKVGYFILGKNVNLESKQDFKGLWENRRLVVPRDLKRFSFSDNIELEQISIVREGEKIFIENLGVNEVDIILKDNETDVAMNSERKKSKIFVQKGLIDEDLLGNETAFAAEVNKGVKILSEDNLRKAYDQNRLEEKISELNNLFHFVMNFAFNLAEGDQHYDVQGIRITSIESIDILSSAFEHILYAISFISGYDGLLYAANEPVLKAISDEIKGLFFPSLHYAMSFYLDEPIGNDQFDAEVQIIGQEGQPQEITLEYESKPILIELADHLVLTIIKDNNGVLKIFHNGENYRMDQKTNIGRTYKQDIGKNIIVQGSSATDRYLEIVVNGSSINIKVLESEGGAKIRTALNSLKNSDQFRTVAALERAALAEMRSHVPNENSNSQQTFETAAHWYDMLGFSDKASSMRVWAKAARKSYEMHIKYSDLRLYSYSFKETGGEDNIEETIAYAKKSTKGVIPRANEWLWRQPDYLLKVEKNGRTVRKNMEDQGLGDFRISANVIASEKLIDKLDELIRTQKVKAIYKVPPTVGRWAHRNDPVTIYLYEGDLDQNLERKKEIMDIIYETLKPFIRKNAAVASLSGESFLDYEGTHIAGLAMEKTPTESELFRLMDLAYDHSLDVGLAVDTGFIFQGRYVASSGRVHIVKNYLKELGIDVDVDSAMVVRDISLETFFDSEGHEYSFDSRFYSLPQHVQNLLRKLNVGIRVVSNEEWDKEERKIAKLMGGGLEADARAILSRNRIDIRKDFRLGEQNDTYDRTITHEIGHILDKSFGLMQRLAKESDEVIREVALLGMDAEDIDLERWRSGLSKGLKGSPITADAVAEALSKLILYDENKARYSLAFEFYRKNLHKVFDGLSDVMMNTQKSPGGIDLNSDMLDIEMKGQVKDFGMIVDPEVIKGLNINGLTPFIISIVPTNVHLLLGLQENFDENIGI